MGEEVLVPVVAILALAALPYLIVKTIVDNMTRRKLVDAGVPPDTARAVLETPRPELFGSLKWGLILVSIGIGLMFVQLYSLDGNEPLTYGLLAMFAGLGLLVYYGTASWLLRRSARHAAGEVRR